MVSRTVRAVAAAGLAVLTAGVVPALADDPEANTNVPVADVPGQTHAADDIVIHDPWLRARTAHTDLLGVYFSVENTSDNAHLIDGISSPACVTMSGYHSDLEVSPLARELFTRLTVPPKQVLVFPPGGYHLLCRVAQGVKVENGATVDVTFHFLGGTEKKVSFPIRQDPS